MAKTKGEWIRADEALELLSTSRPTLDKLVKQGKITMKKKWGTIGRDNYYSMSDIQRLTA